MKSNSLPRVPLFLLVILLAFLCQPGITTAQADGTAGYTVAASGLGRTTGHIADLTVTNNSSDTIVIAAGEYYIPSDGNQPYYGRIPEDVKVPPGATVKIPVYGYCLDVHKEPVPPGVEMVPYDEWVLVQPGKPVSPGDPTSTAPTPTGTPSQDVPDTLRPTFVVPAFEPGDIPGIETSPGFTRVEPDEDEVFIPTYPGTDRPIPGHLDPSKDKVTIAPVLIEIVREVESGSDIILGPLFPTPFGYDTLKEKETVRQHTIWIATSHIEGDPYEKEDFTNNTYREFENQTGVPVVQLEEEDKEQLDTGIDAFWETFTATGLAAKVVETSDSETGQALGEELGPRITAATRASAATSPRCLRWGEMPNIDDRAGWDLIGDLYRHGDIESDYLNDVRAGVLQRKVDAIRGMHRHLQNILTTDYNVFPCDDENAHNEDHPVSFPDFPWEDVSLQVDLCADNSGKNSLYDYLHPDADTEALREWMRDYEWAVDNLGVWRPEDQRSYMEAWQAMINSSMNGLGEAYDEFEKSVYATLAIQYNRSRAEAHMWGAIVTIAAAIASAGIGAAGAGMFGAMASACASMAGFVWEQGFEALGMDPQIAKLVSSLMTLGLSAGQAWGRNFAEEFGEGMITSTSTDVLTAGISEMAQKNATGYAMGLGLLNDDVWDDFIGEVAKDYTERTINTLNQHREVLRAEMERHIASLCKIYNSLDALLPGLLRAHEETEQWLHSSFWKDLWQEADERSWDCCCEWSDGRSIRGCVIDIPEFGYNPRTGN